VITYLFFLLAYSTQWRNEPKQHCSVMSECANHGFCVAVLQDTVMNSKVKSSVKQV